MTGLMQVASLVQVDENHGGRPNTAVFDQAERKEKEGFDHDYHAIRQGFPDANPLPSKCGRYQKGKTRFWPWLYGESP